jgi:hypothetical protein
MKRRQVRRAHRGRPRLGWGVGEGSAQPLTATSEVKSAVEFDLRLAKPEEFDGAAEIGPLMAKTAILNLSPRLTGSRSTMRLGILKPWIAAGLGLPAVGGSSPLTQTSGQSSTLTVGYRQGRSEPEERHHIAASFRTKICRGNLRPCPAGAAVRSGQTGSHSVSAIQVFSFDPAGGAARLRLFSFSFPPSFIAGGARPRGDLLPYNALSDSRAAYRLIQDCAPRSRRATLCA